MSKSIAPSGLLTKCPNCNAQLKLNNDFTEGDSVCMSCEYSEPAGGAKVVTFISACLSEYARVHDVDTAFLGGHEFPISSCMEGNGLLPVLVERARQIQTANGYDKMPGMGIPLKLVDDIKGPLGYRVVYTGDPINIATTMSFLCETIHEAIALTKAKGTKFYESQICLDYLPNIDRSINVSETVAGKMQDAFQKAYVQQSSGVKVNGS